MFLVWTNQYNVLRGHHAGTNIKDLPETVPCAEVVRKVLKYVMKVADENFIEHDNPEKDELIEAFKQLMERVEELQAKGEIPGVVFSYHGHGVVADQRGQQILLNADPDFKKSWHLFNLEEKCMAFATICPVLSLMDCCRTKLKHSL